MFLHAMVDVARYDRQFGNCGAKVKDLTSHGLQKCPMVEHLCRIFEITMGLYNAPDELDMRNKSQVMREELMMTGQSKTSNYLIEIFKTVPCHNCK